eukprot:scaffold46035_cov54-Attheya_sp.AAC.2
MSSFEADAIDWIELDPPPTTTTTTTHDANRLPAPPPLQEPHPTTQTIMPPPPQSYTTGANHCGTTSLSTTITTNTTRDEQLWQEMRRKLEEKEEALFELSATLLTVEAEASSRIQQTERQAHQKIRLAEEQLRRAQTEANVLRASSSSSSSRRISSKPHAPHSHSQHQHATTTPTTVVPSNHAEGPTDRKEDACSMTATAARSRSWNHKKSIVTPPVGAVSSIIDVPTTSMATTNNTPATTNTRHARVDDTDTVGSRLARHLLLHLENICVTGRVLRQDTLVSNQSLPWDSVSNHYAPKKGTKRPLSSGGGSTRSTEPVDVPDESSTNDYSSGPSHERNVNKDGTNETKPLYRYNRGPEVHHSNHGDDSTELEALLMQVALPGPNAVNDDYCHDSLDTLLRHLLTLLVRQLSRVMHSKNSSSFLSSMSRSRSHSRASPPEAMGMDASVPLTEETHRVFKESTDGWRNTNELRVVLRIVRELLTLSWEARQRTRRWIQQSHHGIHHQHHPRHDGPTDTATRSCSMTTTRRIHLGKNMGGGGGGANDHIHTALEARLERAATQLRDTVLPSSHSTPSMSHYSRNKRRRMEWESIDRTDTCQWFVLHLTTLMKGTPQPDTILSTAGAKERRLANSKLQMEAIQLFLVLMSDAPPNNEDDSGENNNNNPWTLWFQKLVSVPCNDHGTKHKTDFLSFLEDNLDISAASEVVDSSIYSRQRYIRKALERTWSHMSDDNADPVGDTESSKKMPDKEVHQQQQTPSSKMGATDDSHTDWNVEDQEQQRIVCWNVKSLIFQTLTRFLLSSKAIRQTLFQEYPSDPQVPMTLARRILAAVLDNLQDDILPQLRSLDNNERTSDDRHDAILDMCMSLMRLFFILAQQTKGIVLLQTKMAIGGGVDQNDEDGQSSMMLHAPSGVTLLIDLLKIAVDRSASCSSSSDQQPSSKAWSALVNHVVALFHLMLVDIQRMRHAIETGKQTASTHNPSVTTLLSITLDRREMFLTCCHLILQGANIDNETKWYARMLLDEISYDEEEEEEMQHSVNDDT